MSLAVTFKETHQFLRKFKDVMIILIAIACLKFKALSLLFPRILNINSFLI